MPFDDNEIYLTSDKRLSRIAAKQTLARWRSEGTGPSFIRFGGKIGYVGADLNKYIASRRVATFEAA